MVATTYTNPADMVSSGLQSYDTTTGVIVGRTITAGSNVSVTNGSGVAGNPTIALASQLSGLSFSYTAPGAYPYTVLTTDFTIGVDASAARVINLPNAPATGSIWVIKDVDGTCTAVNTITVTTPAGVVNIDAAATYVMTVAYASATFQWTGAKYIVI